MEAQGDLVDAVHVLGGDDGTLLDIGEQRDLAPLFRGSGRSARQRSMSGWMPMERSSLTECWVGLVLISPAVGMYGTRVRCMYRVCSRPEFHAHLADGLQERQRLDVPDGAPDLHHGYTREPPAPSRIRRLISSVMWGMTCTVPPR